MTASGQIQMNLVKKSATRDTGAWHSPTWSGNSFLYPKIWHIHATPIVWVLSSPAPTCHPPCYIHTSTTQSSCSNQQQLYNFISCSLPLKQTWALQAHLYPSRFSASF